MADPMWWFTADQHFDHENIIKYCERPFTSAMEMNSTIMKNWNEVVSPKDNVVILGDFAFGNPNYVKKTFIDNLYGNKIFIKGNHDSWYKKDKRYMYNKKVGSAIIWGSHYPLRSWPSGYNLHGHCHGQMEPLSRQLDVGVDVWNFYPVSYTDIMAYFDKVDPRRPLEDYEEHEHYKKIGDHHGKYKNMYNLSL